jgi:hypothetical protein
MIPQNFVAVMTDHAEAAANGWSCGPIGMPAKVIVARLTPGGRPRIAPRGFSGKESFASVANQMTAYIGCMGLAMFGAIDLVR